MPAGRAARGPERKIETGDNFSVKAGQPSGECRLLMISENIFAHQHPLDAALPEGLSIVGLGNMLDAARAPGPPK